MKSTMPAARHAYYLANAAKIKAQAAAWHKANPGKAAAAQKKYRETYPDRRRATVRRTRGVPDPTRPCPTHCELCAQPPDARGMCVDHDHKTGKFRGWLCQLCNSMLGMARDNPDLLLHGAVYLERNK
jgi:hypothetical protein